MEQKNKHPVETPTKIFSQKRNEISFWPTFLKKKKKLCEQKRVPSTYQRSVALCRIPLIEMFLTTCLPHLENVTIFVSTFVFSSIQDEESSLY